MSIMKTIDLTGVVILPEFNRTRIDSLTGDKDGDVLVFGDGVARQTLFDIPFIRSMVIDAFKITRRPTKHDFQNAYLYAIREDIDGEFSYETELTHKMAGWLNTNGFNVNFDDIKKFIENPNHF